MSTADHTISRTSPIAELAPDAPIIITRAMLTAAFRIQRLDEIRRTYPRIGADTRMARAQANDVAARRADLLLRDLQKVAAQTAATQGATA